MATNLYPNPGFESGSVAFDVRELSSGAVVDSTSVIGNQLDPADANFGPVIDGDWSLRVGASTNAETGEIVSVGRRFAAVAASTWSAAVQAAFATAGAKPRLSVGFQKASGANIGTPTHIDGPQAVVKPTWLRLEGVVAPLETAFVVVRLTFYAVTGAAGNVTFDNALLVTGATVPPYPIDGDRGAMEWLGSRFHSASMETEEAPVVADFESWTPPYLWSPKVLPRETE